MRSCPSYGEARPVGPGPPGRIERKAMQPAMVEVLAAEHVRDMLVRAENTRRVSAARHARKAYRAWRSGLASPVPAGPAPASTVPANPAPASTDPVTLQPGRRTQCPQPAMEH